MMPVFRNLVSHRRAGNLLAAFLTILSLVPSVRAEFTPYSARSEFLLTPPGVDVGGFAGYVNPAALSLVPSAESSILLAAGGNEGTVRSDGGWYLAFPHLGFGVLQRQRPGLADLTEIRLGLGLGDEELAFGLARSWARGSRPGDSSVWVAGLVARPSPRWSMATSLTQGSDDEMELAADIGLRPWQTDRLTLFAEGARSTASAGRERFWSLGADMRLVEGIHLSGRFLDGRSISLGLRAEFGQGGFQSQARETNQRVGQRRLFALRFGPHRGDAVRRYRQPVYLDLPLNRPVRHRSFRLLDDSQSHLELLTDLEAARQDPRIMGVAVDLTALRIDPSLSWELRQQLLALRDAGRYVVVYIHRADLRRYHLASAADRIVLDPYGLVGLEGLAAGRLYMADALEKIGIGTQEWRTGEYKSAFEGYRRRDMSEADRAQTQALLEDGYAALRADITQARNLSTETFDYLVDGPAILTADEALQEGLVDTLARWPAVEQLLREEGAQGSIERWRLSHPVETTWGHQPTIAVAYALGLCDLDSGIRARVLSQRLTELADDDDVDAVVLRVDSPGGDALASDWVAEAVDAVTQQKPVIVSHGRVAASGGYWISMEGDAIVTSPHTITGSIGVIGGWMYDQGLKERLGLATDVVQIGDHADLGFGLPIPVLGNSLPDRPLREEEAARVEAAITSMYEQFVARVSETRGHSIAYVDSIARGRVWSGPAAVENGLADTLGTLLTAIDMARDRAAIDPTRQLRIIELPHQDWISRRDGGLFGLVNRLGSRSRTPLSHLDRLQTWVEFRARTNGQAIPMLPSAFFDPQSPIPSSGGTEP